MVDSQAGDPVVRNPCDVLILLDDDPASLAGREIALQLAGHPRVLATINSKLAGPEVYADATRSLSADPKMAEVLTTARDLQAEWVVLRRDIAPPPALLPELLVGAGKAIDDQSRGFAVLLAAPTLAGVKRALVVADQSDRPISGLLAHFAETLGERCGTVLDVLVIGAPGAELDSDLSHQNLDVAREQELFDQAIARGKMAGVEVNWITTTDIDDPWLVISDQIGREQYDLVIDDLGDISLGGAWSRAVSLGDTIAPGGPAEIPLRLLEETDLSVLLVIDAIRLGMISARMLKAGAAAAAALAVVGGGIRASSTTPDAVDTADAQKVLAELTDTADTTTSAAERRDKVDAASRKRADKTESAKVQKVQAPKSVSKSKVAKVKAAKADAAADYKKASAKLKSAKSEAADAEKDLAKAQKAADEAAAELSTAEQTYHSAATEADRLVNRTQGWGMLLPGGPSDEQVAAAQDAATDAEKALTKATEAGEEATQELQDASKEQTAASKALDKATGKAADTKVDYQQAKKAAAVYTETYEDYLDHLIQKPVKSGYHLTARFGQSGGMWSSGYHTGLDFAADIGTNVYAAATGKVISAGWAGAYGNRIEIKHANGVVTTYNHLSKIRVHKGQKVTSGDHIGDVGTTGNSTGPHLHFEVKKNGDFRDPATWLGM